MLHPKIKNNVRDVLMSIGFKNHFLKKTVGSSVIVLHNVDEHGNTVYNSRFISSKNLESLLQYFKKHFYIATLKDFCKGDYPKDQFTVTITFDDGLANNYYKVLPLLEQHNIPASFFITGTRKYSHAYLWSDFIDLFCQEKNEFTVHGTCYKKNAAGSFVSKDGIDCRNYLREQSFENIDNAMKELTSTYNFNINNFHPDYFLQMTEIDIKKLSEHPLATIGSHSMYHTDFTKIPLEDAESEMIESKKYLEAVTGKSIDAFAFPFDIYTEALVNKAILAGYKFILPAFLQKEGTHVQRFGINPYISLNNQLYYLIKGSYS